MADNLWQFVQESFREYPENIAWVRRLPKGRKEQFTYREVELAALNLAAALRRDGYGSGSRIGLLAANGPEWAVGALAGWKLGAVVAPLHAGNSDEELSFQNNALQISLLLYAGDSRGLPNAREIVCSYEEGAAEPESELGSPPGPDDEALRIYTSGSTGSPKIVLLSHHNVISNVLGAQKIDLDIEPSDRFLSLLPLSHCMELTAGMLLPLSRGASIVLPRVLAANEIMQALVEDNVTVMIAVPRLFRNIMEGMQKKFSQGSPFLRVYISFLRVLPLPVKKLLNGPIRSKVGTNVKVWVSGGSRLDPAISGFFRGLGIPLRQGYGLTECSPVVSVQGAWEPLLDSVGRPFEDMDVRIENPDHNGCGQLWVKGPSLMLGYADENQTAEVMNDGWYNTGDIAKLERGRIVLTGRSKRLIVTEAGKNVYPEDLEVLLEREDNVKEAGITEIDMRPAAVLSVDEPDGAEKAREAIKSYNASVSAHNQIARFAVVEELPRTPLGKVALASLAGVFADNEVV